MNSIGFNMRKVLIVGFLWPYIGGSKRVIGLASYLAEFGWEPIVITPYLAIPHHCPFPIIETEYRGFLGNWAKLIGLSQASDLGDQLKSKISRHPAVIKSMFRWGFNKFREVAAYPDENRGWRRYAYEAAAKVLQAGDVKAICSVWPVVGHIVARDLKVEFQVPWVADFPDLWSDNSSYPYSAIRRWFDRRLEQTLLRKADAVTTSSWPLAERLARIHPGRQITDIMLGFDPALVNLNDGALQSKFTITYTGIFYPEKRDPHIFLEAIKELIHEGLLAHGDIQIRFYGPFTDWVERRITYFRLSDVVKQFGAVPFNDCLEKQRESHVLLQINWSDDNEKGVFSGKFLDYLAARRPILAAGGAGNDEVVMHILKETKAGVYAVKKNEIKAAVTRFYKEYEQHGTVFYHGEPDRIDKFSNRHMAARFAEIFTSLSGKMIHGQ